MAEAARVRPKNRKQQILAVAARRFRDVGYHNVGMADLAETVGITAGALYRHFRGKHDLLLAVMHDALDRFDQAWPDATTFDEVASALAAATLERRELGVLWEREARNLPPEGRQEVRRRLRAVSHRVSEAMASRRPRPTPGEADLRAWAVLAVFGSPAYHSVELEPSAFRAVLRDAAQAVAITPLAARSTVVGRSPEPGSLAPASRREALLAAAIVLFERHGYHAVGMADIGAATGITGPSVYGHFTSKSDILEAALNRGSESLLLGLHGALRVADSADDALELVLAGYVDFVILHTELMNLLVTETINLPDEQRHRIRGAQHDYVNEWVTLLRSCRAELDAPTARVLTHAALGVVNALPRIPHVRQHATLADDLVRLGLGVLRS